MPTHAEQSVLFPECPTYQREIRREDKHSTYQNSRECLKNISCNKTNDRYQISIIRNSELCTVSFKDLNDAIAARELILDVYRKTGKLLSRGKVVARIDEMKSKL